MTHWLGQNKPQGILSLHRGAEGMEHWVSWEASLGVPVGGVISVLQGAHPSCCAKYWGCPGIGNIFLTQNLLLTHPTLTALIKPDLWHVTLLSPLPSLNMLSSWPSGLCCLIVFLSFSGSFPGSSLFLPTCSVWVPQVLELSFILVYHIQSLGCNHLPYRQLNGDYL